MAFCIPPLAYQQGIPSPSPIWGGTTNARQPKTHSAIVKMA